MYLKGKMPKCSTTAILKVQLVKHAQNGKLRKSCEMNLHLWGKNKIVGLASLSTRLGAQRVACERTWNKLGHQ